MTRTRLDDAQWVSLMLVMQQIPFAWKRDEAALRRFIEAALWICRTGAPWRDLPETLGTWSSVYHRWRRWCLRGWWEVIFEAMRPSLPADGLLLLDSTTCKAHRAASGAAHSTATAEALGRSRGGLCSKLHANADGAGRILRLIASPGQHSDLRYATALASGIPACNAALDRAMSRPPSGPPSPPRAAPSTPRPSGAWSIRRTGIPRCTPGATMSRTCSPASRIGSASLSAATRPAGAGSALPTSPPP
jgi:transposase